MALILGSSSFARQALLKGLGVDFKVCASSFDERSVSENQDPYTYSKILASKKNEILQPQFPQDVILTLDTIVYLEGKIFNKPKDFDDAFFMLKKLSGKSHQVITSCAVFKKNQLLVDSETTQVKFNELSDEMIEIFLSDPHFIHRAGSYTVTGRGALLVESMNGTYENVIGFPFNTVEKLLNQFGESLWRFPS
jgi:septum formation protein